MRHEAGPRCCCSSSSRRSSGRFSPARPRRSISSTTPRALLDAALYGSGAILVREMARRRGLGWPSLLTLGAAYGVFEEALVVNTWFSHAANVGSLASYGRIWGINAVWALELTVFHAVMSICVPIALVEAAFPHIAARPWLRRRGLAPLQRPDRPRRRPRPARLGLPQRGRKLPAPAGSPVLRRRRAGAHPRRHRLAPRAACPQTDPRDRGSHAPPRLSGRRWRRCSPSCSCSTSSQGSGCPPR